MRILNLGILAHVDAGKTTLTERLLYAAGVLDHVGSVDDGSTLTDFLPLERQRGITIKSAVVNFALGGISVNLIDTPGHPDFIAEVERILCALDGAVLVISAVEGVQAQTRVLMRVLQRLHIPTLIFVNKIDRPGAQEALLLDRIRNKLVPGIVPMGTTVDLGGRTAAFQPVSLDAERFALVLLDVLSEHDDELVAAYSEGVELGPEALQEKLVAATRSAGMHPVFFGSALTGAGVDDLMVGIEQLLPATAGDSEQPPSGTIFKIERSPRGEKVAFVRMFSGCLNVRQSVRYGAGHEAKIKAITVFENGESRPSQCLAAGRIGKLLGLSDARIGDLVGSGRRASSNGEYFAPPTLETAVTPVHPAEKSHLHIALTRLAEQDPLINLRQDDARQELYVSLYGEVQKEVIEATLSLEFGVEAVFHGTTPIYIERVAGTGHAVEWLGQGGNPFLATIGLRIEPGPIGTGIEFRMEAPVMSMPLYVFKSAALFVQAMEENVRVSLQAGLLGWQVKDCIVTMTECAYAAPATQAKSYRLLTPLVLMAALSQAGTVVCEPLNHFEIEAPPTCVPAVLSLLNRLDAASEAGRISGDVQVLSGRIPSTRVDELRHMVPGLTHGEGVIAVQPGGYRPVTTPDPPVRLRADLNPLNRQEYLLRLAGRLS